MNSVAMTGAFEDTLPAEDVPALDSEQARLYHYYRTQTILPTFADLKDTVQLEQMSRARARFFRDKLRIPLRTFEGVDLLEFGPDSGEHALIFASWGARLTLVEPNLRAHGRILSYFKQFDQNHALKALLHTDVEGLEHSAGYSTGQQFSFIAAEGFIYTIQPSQRWLEVFSRLLRPDGLCVVSYYERLGGLIELSLRALHSGYQKATGQAPEQAARQLFTAKWDAIPHTRSFSSWVMDVLENPFVRRRTFLSARGLLEEAAANGLELYSSWPLYEDTLQNYWHKKVLTRDERVRQAGQHTQRASIGYVCGIKAYDVGVDPAASHRLCEALLERVDAYIDTSTPAVAAEIGGHFQALAERVKSPEIFIEETEARARLVRLFEGYARAFMDLGAGRLDALREWCSTDPAFISEWGMPFHFAVFRKSDEE